MVSSMTKKIISLAISLLVVVISLTGVALGATAPSVSTLSRYTPGFAGTPGKMARDGAGNFYVSDFWGKQIVKLDRQGVKIGAIATAGRPSAVAVMPDGRLVVAMAAPEAYVAFYSQVQTGSGANRNLSGTELGRFGTTGGTPAYTPLYRPSGIAVDAANYIYVLDAGDSSNTSNYWGKVRVYSSAGVYLHAFGTRGYTNAISTDEGVFRQPSGIAYESVANRIVVADTMNSRLQFFGAYSAGACAYVGSVGTSMFDAPAIGSEAKLGDPTDVAFEYNAGSLYRMYVTERGRNEITIVNMEGLQPGTVAPFCTACTDLKRIDKTIVEMKYPSGVLFEKTSTGGVLYTDSAAVSNAAAGVLALSIADGSVPVPNTLTISPAVPVTSSSASLSLTGTVSPLADVYCGVNGVWNAVKASGASSWSDSVTLQLGDNHVVCKSTSGDVTTYAEAYTTYASSPSPITVSIDQPVAGLITNNASVVVSGTSDTANATVSVAGGTATVYTMTNALGNWSAPITLPVGDGAKLITVTAEKPGKSVGTATRTVNYDGSEPVITASFLTEGATTNSAVQNIDGVVSDPNLDLTSIKVDGVALSAAEMVTLADNSTYFSFPVTLARNSKGHVVKVTAADLAGNVATFSRTVNLVPEKPGFTIALPADNSYLPSTGSISASGTADNGFSFVNSYAVSGGAWSGAQSAQAGFYEYPFVATGSNASISLKRTIITDAAYGQLAITNPPADLATRGTWVDPSYLNYIDVSGNVAPDTATAPTIAVSGGADISNSSYVQSSGAFSFRVTFPAPGTYSVKVTSGTTTAIRNLIYDNVAPHVTIQADSKPTPALISGVIDQSDKIAGITATLSGSPVNIPVSVVTFEDPVEGSVVWQANLSGYTYNSIAFNVTDPAGNQKAANICVVPAHPGDIDNDGTVRLSDALAALRHVAGTQILSTEEFKRADIGELVKGRTGCDGIVDISDSVLILSKSYGLLTF